MSPASSVSSEPFKPVTKSDAAVLLGVCTKTIDNYVREGLLPQPARLGGRDLWLPEVFYSHLRHALTPSAGIDRDGMGTSVASEPARSKTTGHSKPKAPRASPGKRMEGRQERLLARLNSD
jgi:hypothetical protein